MAKRKESTERKKQTIVDAKKRGYSNRRLAVLFQVGHSTVNRIVNRFKEEGSVSNRQRSGRPRKTSARYDRRLVKIVKDDPRKTATDKSKRSSTPSIKKDADFQEECESSLGICPQAFGVVRCGLGRVLWSDESKYNLFSFNGIR
uniref:Transposase n=1 Tax=Ditylenchus dipsaci TaxID=166011 RepID=A0A915CP72_9BILA